MTDLLPAPETMACIQVLGAGQLCGRACDPGHVHCAEHRRPFVDARAASTAVEAARARVLLRLEEHADDLADALVAIATDTTQPGAARVTAISRAMQLLGMDKVQVEVQVDDGPAKAGRDRRLLDLLERAGAGDRVSLVREALAIDTTATES